MKWDRKRIMLLTFVAVLLYWVFDALFEGVFFERFSFLDLLILDAPAHVLYHRAMGMVILTLFGMMTVSLMGSRQKAEERLSESERRMGTVLDSVHELVILHEPGLHIIWTNRAAAESVGFSPEVMKGRHCFDVWHGRETPCEGCPVVKAFADGQFHEAEMRTPDGRIWRVCGYPIQDAQGRVQNVVETTLDITETMRTQEALAFERAQLLSIFDGFEEIVYVTDPVNNEVLFVNRYFRELLGHDPVGKKCFREFQNLDAPCSFCTNHIILKEKGKPYRWEFHNENLQRDFDIFDRIITWPDGRDVRFEIAVDVTERRKAQAQLRGYAENLETEVVERTNERDSARADLFQQSKLAAMGRMGAGIAHQLGSPLTSAMLHMDTLLDHCQDRGEAHGMLVRVRKSLSDMREVLDCMLSLAVVDRHEKPGRRRADLNARLQHILDLNKLDCTKRSIEIRTDLDPELPLIETNIGELGQVFLNLINNAIDAMKDGGLLLVESRLEGEHILIRIADTGCGIAPEHMPRLYEPFFTTRLEEHGVGIGLPLVRQIIDRYQGTIEVASELGKGTVFTVRLPLEEPTVK